MRIKSTLFFFLLFAISTAQNSRLLDNQNNIKSNMVLVEGGTFYMGRNSGDIIERPAHKVTVKDFYISRYEVTFADYDRYCEATGRSKPDDEGWGRGNRPVIHLTKDEMIEYCSWVGGRLPTEAEWEFAARGGRSSKGYRYAGSNTLSRVAWYDANSYNLDESHPDYGTHPVGEKQPNELGLYDMNGNVWEMVSDWFDEDYYANSPINNPKGPKEGNVAVLRGGSWFDIPKLCRPTARVRSFPNYRNYDIGFRVVKDR